MELRPLISPSTLCFVWEYQRFTLATAMLWYETLSGKRTRR